MTDDIFSTGDLIIVSSGEYSSYGVSSIVKALRDFTSADIERSAAYTPPKGTWDGPRISIEKLIEEGFVEEMPPCREIWIGEN